MDAAKLMKGVALWKEAESIFASGPLDYYLTNLVASYDLLINRYAPFKVGDRVALTKTPTIDMESAPGWMHSKHFLKKGAQGTVLSSDCGTRGFTFGVEFDDETWIDHHGKEQPPSQKHSFHFGEKYLFGVPPELDTCTEP